MESGNIRIGIARLMGWIGETALPFISYRVLRELRKERITTSELRVKYLNTLRGVVSRDCPKNKAGSPLVSDYDLCDASDEQQGEALLRTLQK